MCQTKPNSFFRINALFFIGGFATYSILLVR